DQGRLGKLYAIEAVFHNAYGPDKPWFYRRSESGGGCLLDLGIHLVDLAMWCAGFPAFCAGHAIFRNGDGDDPVEDHATALVEFERGIALQLACSWRAPAGCDADISLRIFGSDGGASFRNANGSFMDFTAELLGKDRSRTIVAAPPDDWSGRAAIAWAEQLATSAAYDPSVETAVAVAQVLDSLYAS
ncbi:MAG: Gfo/Idh/MocA family oxidoreductase, partial [Verrucomicrobiaceae bacterium]